MFSITLGSGGGIDCKHSSSELRLTFTVQPYGRESVVISYPHNGYDAYEPEGLRRAIKIRARRYLSEIRDNYISRNEWLLSLAGRLKDRLLS